MTNVAHIITVCRRKAVATKTGTAGRDIIEGGVSADNIDGRDGNDSLYGWGGNDILKGGNGNDSISAGGGNDTVYGGTGNDWLGGGDGDDKVYGEAGNDTILGHQGTNYLYGGTGDDSVFGGNNADRIYGNDGLDYIIGNQGNDLIYGGNHNDTLEGSYGNDIVYGESGNDRLNGGSQNDQLFGGSGNDHLSGASGADMLRGGTGADTLSDNGATGEATRFVFDDGDAGVGELARDAIIRLNKSNGSRIDLSLVDANHSTVGDQAFNFIGSGAFTGLGQVRVLKLDYKGDIPETQNVAAGGYLVQANNSGNTSPDMEIVIWNWDSLPAKDWFLL